MKDVALAVMVVGVLFLIVASFLTPALVARFGLPEAWGDPGPGIWATFGAMSVIGGVLWWIGWQREDNRK